MNSNWRCSHCGTVLSDYGDVGYDGTATDGVLDPHNQGCHPFMEWVTLCHDCAKNYFSATEDVDIADSL